MKTIIFFVILFFYVSALFAQAPVSFIVKDNVHWVERTSTEEGSPDKLDEINLEYELDHFTINGDSIVNGLVYKKLFVNDRFFRNIREDENRIIYYCESEGKESVLYHFNWNDKDYLDAMDIEGKKITMKALDSGKMVLADGNSYAYVKVDYDHSLYSHSKDLRFIQGIGLTQGIFQHVLKIELDCYCYNDLVNLYDGDKLIYQNPLFTEQGGIASDIAQNKSENLLSVLTKDREVIFTLKDSSGKENMTLFVYNDKGEELAIHKMSNGVFSLQNLQKGVYLYRLKINDESKDIRKFVIGK